MAANGRLYPVLTEFKDVRQEPRAGHRRWFEEGGLELIVWYDQSGKFTGFQLCYVAVDGRERALTWEEGHGFTHTRVESGDTRPEKNLSPILVPDGAVPWTRVRQQFAVSSAGLEPAIRKYVTTVLEKGNG